jgi:hypothetical protein
MSSTNLTSLKQLAAEEEHKKAEAAKEAAITIKELSVELVKLATSMLVEHYGEIAVADLTVSQESVNRIAVLPVASMHREAFDFDLSVEGVHFAGTANAPNLRLFHDKRLVSVIDVLAVLPPESKSAIVLKTRIEEAKAAHEKALQEASERFNSAVEAIKTSIAESVKTKYGVVSVDAVEMPTDLDRLSWLFGGDPKGLDILRGVVVKHGVFIIIDEKRFKAEVFQDAVERMRYADHFVIAVARMRYADHFVIRDTASLIKALDGTFDAELDLRAEEAKAAEATKAEATKAALTRQRRFFRR